MDSAADRVKSDSAIIVHADKTVLKIGGLKIRGLNTGDLERILTQRLQSTVRVIGVTGTSVDMDVYGVDEERILRDSDGIIRAVALAQGITLTDLAAVERAEKIIPVAFDAIPGRSGCAGERWIRHDT